MYVNYKGLREWRLEQSSFIRALDDTCSKWGVDKHNVKFYSQQDEDKFIIQYFLDHRIEDGTFLEVGGHDGVEYSNTRTLEDYFGFKGILIEAREDMCEKMIKNRPGCLCFNTAISNSDSKFIEFVGDNAMAGCVMNVETDLERFNNRNSYYVKNSKMSDVLNSSRFEHIDFMVIDVEGGEMDVVKSIDFSFPIFCIIIEASTRHMETNRVVGDYLESKGFRYVVRQRGNEVWINPNCERASLFKIPKSHSIYF